MSKNDKKMSLVALSFFLLTLSCFDNVEAQETERFNGSPTTNTSFSLPARQMYAPAYEGIDIEGNSPACVQRRQYFPEVSQCDLRGESTSASQNVRVELLRQEGNRLARDLKTDYFSKIESALVSQYAAAAWLSNENPLSSKNGRIISKAIEEALQKCTGTDRFQIEHINQKIKDVNPLTVLKLDNLPKDHLDRSREFIQKRMLIAWIELNRIGRFLTDRPISKETKESLKKRRQMIRQTYPLISTSYDGYLLRRLAEVHYGQVFEADSTQSHPQINKILFPDNEGKYSAVEPGGQTRQGNEGMLNQILSQPIHPQIEAEINNLMASSLKNSFESVGAFCSLNPCQTMTLDLETTAQKINQKEKVADTALAAACSCNLMSPTEYFDTGTQLTMAGVTLGGLVLCPFTFGIGCSVSAAGAIGLTTSSVANTYGAIKDRNEIVPLVRTVLALPGLSDKERQKILKKENENSGRILGGVAETIAGGIPEVAMIKQGTKVLTSAKAFRPIARSTVNGEKILKSTNSQMEELKGMGVKFEKQDRTTYVEIYVNSWPDEVRYTQSNAAEPHYGNILKVTELPASSRAWGLSTKALEHPEMAEYMKRMEELGIDLVVDTSLRELNSVGAYFRGHTHIALRPDSTWQNFIHEFQHAQFDAFIASRLPQLKTVVQQGGSIKDILPPKVVADYGDREMARLQKLLEQGHTERGINETMSTARELDALGWKQYLPFSGSSPRIYGATHRVDSLVELKKQGFQLTATQEKSLMKSRAVVILLRTYNVGAQLAPGAMMLYYGPPAIVIKTIDGAFKIYRDIKIIYNEKTGDVITQTPDGQTISTRYEKDSK